MPAGEYSYANSQHLGYREPQRKRAAEIIRLRWQKTHLVEETGSCGRRRDLHDHLAAVFEARLSSCVVRPAFETRTARNRPDLGHDFWKILAEVFVAYVKARHHVGSAVGLVTRT